MKDTFDIVIGFLAAALISAVIGAFLVTQAREDGRAAGMVQADRRGSLVHTSTDLERSRLSCVQNPAGYCAGKDPSLDAFIDCGAVAQATCETTAPSP